MTSHPINVYSIPEDWTPPDPLPPIRSQENEHIVVDSMVYEIEVGAMWESYPFSLITNDEIYLDKNELPCPHCHSLTTTIETRHDKSTYENYYCINPLVVVVSNEGECNSTGLCVACLQESLKKYNLNK